MPFVEGGAWSFASTLLPPPLVAKERCVAFHRHADGWCVLWWITAKSVVATSPVTQRWERFAILCGADKAKLRLFAENITREHGIVRRRIRVARCQLLRIMAQHSLKLKREASGTPKEMVRNIKPGKTTRSTEPGGCTGFLT